MRSKLQEAEQARRSGTRLGAAGTEADWMAAVRMGRKRRSVGADALSEATVSPQLLSRVLILLFHCHLTPPQLACTKTIHTLGMPRTNLSWEMK